MTLESQLERIAVALEKIEAKTPALHVPNQQAQAPLPPLPGTPIHIAAAPAAAPPSVITGNTIPETSKPKKVKSAKPAEPAPAAAPAETVKAPTAAEIAHAVMAVANKVNRQAAIDLMAKFGAQRASELKAADYIAVKAAADALLSNAPAPKPAPTDSLI